MTDQFGDSADLFSTKGVENPTARMRGYYVGVIPNEFAWKQVLMGLAIGVAIGSVILARSLLTGDGYLSLDSMSYLALAQNLNLGHGFSVQNGGYFPAGPEYFATWPVGYPFAIRVLCALTGLSPFMASKMFGVLAVTSCTCIVANVSGRHGAVLALPFAFGACLEIFSYSWSEVPFIFFLVMAAVLLSGIIGNPGRADVARSLGLAACCLGLFMSRYVGAFGLALIGFIILLKLWRREYRLAALNCVTFLVAASFIWFYLRHNAAMTGYMTGMPRTAPLDSPAHRFAMLMKAVAYSAVLPAVRYVQDYRATPCGAAQDILFVAVLTQIVGLAILARHVLGHYRRPWRDIRIDSLALSFVMVGTLYLTAIVTLRWLSQFDPYDFRLLGPGVLLITIAVFRMALISWPQAARAIGRFAVAMAALSLVLALLPLASPAGPGYQATARLIERRYASLPPGAIVVFGNENLRYLRPDLFIAEPMCKPWFDEDESWSRFLAELDRRHPIFLDMTGHALRPVGCQASVRAALVGHRAGDLFKLT